MMTGKINKKKYQKPVRTFENSGTVNPQISYYVPFENVTNTKNQELKKVLEHNRDEEKEHAAMLMELIRKLDKTQDKMFEEHD